MNVRADYIGADRRAEGPKTKEKVQLRLFNNITAAEGDEGAGSISLTLLAIARRCCASYVSLLERR